MGRRCSEKNQKKRARVRVRGHQPRQRGAIQSATIREGGIDYVPTVGACNSVDGVVDSKVKRQAVVSLYRRAVLPTLPLCIEPSESEQMQTSSSDFSSAVIESPHSRGRTTPFRRACRRSVQESLRLLVKCRSKSLSASEASSGWWVTHRKKTSRTCLGTRCMS